MYAHALAVLAPFLPTVLAAPAPAPAVTPRAPIDIPAYTCTQGTHYDDVKVSEQFWGAMAMANIPPTTSNPEDPGTLSHIYTHSIGVTITVGFNLGADLPKAVGSAGIGFGLSASYAWAYTDTTGYSDSVSCPPGDPQAYLCSASQRTKYVYVTGTAVKSYGGTCTEGKSAAENVISQTPFNFTAPVILIKDSETGTSQADSAFYACICGASTNQTTMSNFQHCPSLC